LKKGVAMEVILDSCHSGTGTREMIRDRTALRDAPVLSLEQRALWASRHCIRPRFLPAPPDIAHRSDEVFGLLKLVRASLKHEGFSQVPQLECSTDRAGAAVFS
jgi:hypothetical protein